MKTKNLISFIRRIRDKIFAAVLAAMLTASVMCAFGFTLNAYYESELKRLDAEVEVHRLSELTDGQRMEISRLETKLSKLEADFEALRRYDRDEELHEAHEAQELVSLGKFKLTHYCACSKCCGKWANGITATGTKAEAGRTIAVDPDVIPLGTAVYIDGQKYIAEDTGSAIDGKRIDVFMNDHLEAKKAGVRSAEVFMQLSEQQSG